MTKPLATLRAETWQAKIVSHCDDAGSINALLARANHKKTFLLSLQYALDKQQALANYLYGTSPKVNLKIVLVSGKQRVKKKFLAHYSKNKPLFLPVIQYAPAFLDNETIIQNIALSIQHEYRHLQQYKNKEISNIPFLNHFAPLETDAWIAGICGGLASGNLSLESAYLPSFKPGFIENMSVVETLRNNALGKAILARNKEGSRKWQSALGYVQGAFLLWRFFGISVEADNTKKQRNVIKFCRWLSCQPLDIKELETMNRENLKQQLEEIPDPPDDLLPASKVKTL